MGFKHVQLLEVENPVNTKLQEDSFDNFQDQQIDDRPQQCQISLRIQKLWESHISNSFSKDKPKKEQVFKMVMRHFRRWLMTEELEILFQGVTNDKIINNIQDYIQKNIDTTQMEYTIELAVAKIVKLQYGDRIRTVVNVYDQLLRQLGIQEQELKLYSELFGTKANDSNIIEFFADPLNQQLFMKYCLSLQLIVPLLKMDSVEDSDCSCNLHQLLKQSEDAIEIDSRMPIMQVQQTNIKLEQDDAPSFYNNQSRPYQMNSSTSNHNEQPQTSSKWIKQEGCPQIKRESGEPIEETKQFQSNEISQNSKMINKFRKDSATKNIGKKNKTQHRKQQKNDKEDEESDEDQKICLHENSKTTIIDMWTRQDLKRVYDLLNSCFSPSEQFWPEQLRFIAQMAPQRAKGKPKKQ